MQPCCCRWDTEEKSLKRSTTACTSFYPVPYAGPIRETDCSERSDGLGTRDCTSVYSLHLEYGYKGLNIIFSVDSFTYLVLVLLRKSNDSNYLHSRDVQHCM